MKRVVLLLGFGIICIGAVFYAAPRYVAARKTADRNAAYARTLAENGPLVLDRTTQAILENADRVETFRLADFHEGENRSAEEQAILDGPHVQALDDYTVLHIGSPQGSEFAAALRAAVSEIPLPIGRDGLVYGGVPSCFDPGIGFRVWKGKAHVDLCVCFYCTGIQIITTDAHGKQLVQMTTTLGASRPAFLALSKQAFPQDKQLAALPDQL